MILFIVILVAAFNVVSSLMLVVTDRRRAVAMLMAMGGQGRPHCRILLQGGLIGLVGALAGMLLGYGLAVTPDMANWLEQYWACDSCRPTSTRCLMCPWIFDGKIL